MGEVYAAIDTRTGERVALKVLSQAALADPEHRRRFLHEAKTIGILSHPNIVKLYEAGSAKVDGADIHFIAMELVEGRTLDQLIPAGGMQARAALDLAVPIAAALEAAHAAGVVHRDLKPRNIIVTAENVPKILDFGLAKRTAPAASGPGDQTMSLAHSMTMSGSILGTAAYMPPEQADGKATDGRGDIFSFGAILYEMVTGQRAFRGDSAMSIISAVMKSEPEPIEASRGVPPAMVAVIERCLRKDPARRHQSMGDVRVSLEDVPLRDVQAAPVTSTSRRTWLTGVAAGTGGLVAGALAGRRLWYRPMPELVRLTYRRGDVMSARFGPNGEVIYSAAWGGDPLRTFIAQPGNRESRPLDLPPAWVQSVSARGDLAVLLGREQTGTLARVPIGGGTPREILEGVNWADWSPNGQAMAIVRRAGNVFRLEYPVGNVLLEASARKPELPRISADGARVAVLVYDTETGDYALNIVGPDKRPRAVSRGFRVVGGLAWAAGDVLVSGARPGGPPAVFRFDSSGNEQIAYRMPGWPHLMDCAPNGDLLAAAVTSRLGIAALTPFSGQEQDLAWLDGSSVNDLSADGKTLLFTEISSGEGRNTEIYLRKTDGSPAVRIGNGNRASLSQDGRFVACLRNAAEGNQIAILPAGPGEERTLSPDGMRYGSVECHPDGLRVLFSASTGSGPRRAYLRPIAGGAAIEVTPPGVAVSKISPDGKFAVSAAGKIQLWPLGGGEPRTVATLAEGDQVCRWSGDGRELFLANVEHGGSAVELSGLDVSTGRRRPLRKLVPMEPGAVFWGLPALSADGAYYAASFRKDFSDLYLIKGAI